MFGRVYLPVVVRGLIHFKSFRIFGIGDVLSRADRFDSLLQRTSWETLEGSFD